MCLEKLTFFLLKAVILEKKLFLEKTNKLGSFKCIVPNDRKFKNVSSTFIENFGKTDFIK